MTQNPYSAPSTRSATGPAAVAGDELDALVESMVGEEAGGRPQTDVPRAEAPRVRDFRPRVEPRNSDAQAGSSDRALEELRAQIRSIAVRVQALSESATSHGEHDRAIQELRQTMRELRQVAPQTPQPSHASFNAEIQLPALQIKLVLAETAYLLQQANKDVAVLTGWAMLFSGITLGITLGLLVGIAQPYTTSFWICFAVGVFALLVTVIFAVLTRQARRRVHAAQRAMDESTITRMVTTGN